MNIGNSAAKSASVIETLEDRRLLSGYPLVAIPTELPSADRARPLVVSSGFSAKLSHPAPGKILAGNGGATVLTIKNFGADALSGSLGVTLAASSDGATSAGTLVVGSVPTTLTVRPHGTARVLVPFTVPSNLAAGHYSVLGTVTFDGTTSSVTAPGKLNVTVPPGPVTSPSLIGDYNGLIHESHTDGGFFGGGTTTHLENYTVRITGQTLNSLTASVDVGGTALIPGTYTGSETSAGKFDYTFTAPGGYSLHMKGKVRANGSILTGTVTGTFPGALFSNINGNFKLARTS